MTVFKNVAYPLKVRKMGKAEIEKRLAAADERLQAFEKNPEDLQSLAEEFAFLQKNQTAVREALLAFDQGLA